MPGFVFDIAKRRGYKRITLLTDDYKYKRSSF